MKSTEILVAACLTAATLMGATLRADDEAIILSEIADLHELAVETAFNESPQFQTELLAVIDELEDALFGELQAAFEAAGVLDDLDSFLVEGGQLGFGAYDSSGIFDPFGAGSSLGSDSPGGGGSFYGLFGPGQPSDPFDSGLPDSPSHPWSPNIEGAISGVAGRRSTTYESRSQHPGGVDRTYRATKTVSDDGTVFLREETTSAGGESGPYRIVTTRTSHNGQTDVILQQAFDEQGLTSQSAWGRTNEDGTGTYVFSQRGEDGEYQTVTAENIPLEQVEPQPGGGEVGTNELTNPEYTEGSDCIIPWLCNEESPGTLLLAASRGATQALTPDPADDTIQLQYVDPILTQFDLLSNPGYIDSLIIEGVYSTDPNSGVPLDNPFVYE